MGAAKVRPVPPSKVFAKRLAVERRRKNNWSAEDLSRETKALGHEISRSTIAKIESASRGAKGVTLDEAVVLAAALEIPLGLLLLPTSDTNDVAVTPRIRMTPWRFFNWINGLAQLPQRSVDAQTRGAWPLRKYNDYLLARHQLDLERRGVWRAEGAAERDAAEAAYSGQLRLLMDIADTLQQLSNIPTEDLLTEDEVEDMRTRGMID